MLQTSLSIGQVERHGKKVIVLEVVVSTYCMNNDVLFAEHGKIWSVKNKKPDKLRDCLSETEVKNR